MNLLSTIRSRAGTFVVIVVGLALLAFVGEGLISRMGYGHGDNGPADVGEVNGHSVSREEYAKACQQLSAGESVSSDIADQVHVNAWQLMLAKYMMQPQFDDLGLSVSDKELSNMLYSDEAENYVGQYFMDPNTRRYYQGVALPDGRLNMEAVRNYIKSIQPGTQDDLRWATQEQSVKMRLLSQKYMALITKGLYVTQAEAKRQFNEENTLYTFRYVTKSYNTISDSTLKVTDDELKAYYNDHLWMFPQDEEVRDAEFVSFDVNPTLEDTKLVRDAFVKVGEAWKKAKNDTDFVKGNAETPNPHYTDMSTGSFPAGKDSAFLKAAAGDIIGPEQLGETFTIYKVTKQVTQDDSARARHILIAYKGAERSMATVTKEQAKKTADSIAAAVRSDKTKWEALYTKYSADPGGTQKDPKTGKLLYPYGDYGWLNTKTGMGTGFAKPYMEFTLEHKVGDVEVVETTFGYHVMQKLESSKTSSRKVRVLSIDKKIVPSQKTYNEILAKASNFAGKNHTPDQFIKGADADKMNRQVAKKVHTYDRNIGGLPNGLKLVNWMYAEGTVVGSISEPLPIDRHFVVARLTKIVPKGNTPLDEDEVHKQCEVGAKKEKKAKMVMDEFTKLNASSIDAYAAGLKTDVRTAANVNFNAATIQGVGGEPVVAGMAAHLQKGALSKPIKGEQGVFVIVVDNVTAPTQPLTDVKAKQAEVSKTLGNRALQTPKCSAFEVLRDKANIVDERIKVYNNN